MTALLDTLFTFEFNVLTISENEQLIPIVSAIFNEYFKRTNYSLNIDYDNDNLLNFITDIFNQYQEVPYHNFYHATHVLHTVYMMLDTSGLFERMNPHILFALLISALVHDADHPGNNNSFEINTSSDLAKKYNNISVLENHHCHLAFLLADKHHLFDNFTHEQYIICEYAITSCILGTDMMKHKENMDILKSRVVRGFQLSSIDEQYLLAKVILHAADIGNPILTHSVCESWGRKVSAEFMSQSEKEKDLGLQPSFDISDKLSFYKNEISYIQHVCKPYWSILSDMFNEWSYMYCQIITNLTLYEFAQESIYI